MTDNSEWAKSFADRLVLKLVLIRRIELKKHHENDLISKDEGQQFFDRTSTTFRSRIRRGKKVPIQKTRSQQRKYLEAVFGSMEIILFGLDEQVKEAINDCLILFLYFIQACEGEKNQVAALSYVTDVLLSAMMKWFLVNFEQRVPARREPEMYAEYDDPSVRPAGPEVIRKALEIILSQS